MKLFKAFSLSRKYAEWCDSEESDDSNSFLTWFSFLIWPLIFSLIGTIVTGCLFQSSIGDIVASSFLSVVLTAFVLALSVMLFKIESMKYQLHCLLSNWLSIILADITLLPLVGIVWFMKELKNHTGLFVDASKRKLSFVSIDDLANGKFKKNRLQPHLFGSRKRAWNEKTILEIAREIVCDQIGRSLKDDETSACMIREIVTLEETQIDKENKSARVCFSVTLCTRDGSDDKIEAGYYFVSLAFDEDLNAVDVSNLFFDSTRGQKTKQERHRAFELYRANTSEDFGLGYDPLGIRDRQELFAEPDFSPDVPVPQPIKIPTAE